MGAVPNGDRLMVEVTIHAQAFGLPLRRGSSSAAGDGRGVAGRDNPRPG
jgi:hypothetical protein